MQYRAMVTRTEISAAYWRGLKQAPGPRHAIDKAHARYHAAIRAQRINQWLESCEIELRNSFRGSAILKDDPHDNFRKVKHG